MILMKSVKESTLISSDALVIEAERFFSANIVH